MELKEEAGKRNWELGLEEELEEEAREGAGRRS